MQRFEDCNGKLPPLPPIERSIQVGMMLMKENEYAGIRI
jgi:hypothetical protein